MKVLLWVHRDQLDNLNRGLKTLEPLEEPVKVSLDQIGHWWIQIMIDYDTFISLQDHNVVRIF